MKQSEVIKKWIEMLRSGEYQQGKGYLHRYQDGVEVFCCLGVLCELAVKEEIVPPPVIDGTTYVYCTKELEECSRTSLIPSVQWWSGIGGGYIDGHYDVTSTEEVMRMNDSDDLADFLTIANYIEEFMLPVISAREVAHDAGVVSPD